MYCLNTFPSFSVETEWLQNSLIKATAFTSSITSNKTHLQVAILKMLSLKVHYNRFLSSQYWRSLKIKNVDFIKLERVADLDIHSKTNTISGEFSGESKAQQQISPDLKRAIHAKHPRTLHCLKWFVKRNGAGLIRLVEVIAAEAGSACYYNKVIKGSHTFSSLIWDCLHIVFF